MDVSSILNTLNDAQRAAVAAPSGPTVVLAGAGSGKTRVLTHRIAWLVQTEGVSPHSILAVTFTNKAAGEMRGRIESLLGVPGGVLWVGTFHGIAHRLLRMHWREARLPQNFQILDAEDQLRLVRKVLKAMELDEARYPPREMTWFINAQKDEGLRPSALKDHGDPARLQRIRIYKAYTDACEQAGVVDFAELLLRAYETWRDNPGLLAHYQQRFRHVLVDEFQDTNTIQYAWLKLLASGNGSIPFVVGDDDQCFPPGTLVTMADSSTKPIEAVQQGDQVLSSFGSGDFRAAEVTEKFVQQRDGMLVCLHMRSGKVIKSTPEHTHFAGYVLGETPQIHFLYLMHKEGIGYRVGTSQVYTQGQAKPMVGFRQRSIQEHADAVWIIRTHPTENEARADEMITSLRYGIPTLPFTPRKGSKAVNGLVHDPRYIARVFQSVDSVGAALKLLDDVGLDADRPHHLPRSRNSNRRNIIITLCGDRRGANPIHRISMVGVSERDRANLHALGLNTGHGKNKAKSWRFSVFRSDFGELMEIAKRIREQLDGRYIMHGHILNRSLPFISASSVRAGMVVATETGFDVVERIEHQSFHSEIYDINVARTHNFIANGVVTHNSIYRWRGAKVENIHQFQKDFGGTKIFKLEQNYRSTGTILHAANALIAHNSGRMGKNLWTEGAQGVPIRLYAAYNERDEADFVVNRIRQHVNEGGLRKEIAILYRSNAQSRAFEEAFLSANIPYRVYGGLRFFERAEIKDALAYLRLTMNRDDDTSFERVINLPARKIGAKSLEIIRDYSRANACSMWRAAGACIGQTVTAEGGLPPPDAPAQGGGKNLLGSAAAASVHGFMRLIEQTAGDIRNLDLHEQVDRVIQKSGLIPHFEKDTGERGEVRVENLFELVSAARTFTGEPGSDLEPINAFLAHAALEAGEGQAAKWEDCVQMMTLHSAKGLEFPIVFMSGLEDGIFPHSRSLNDIESLEEERRLCYVGMTRAMQELNMSYAELRRLHGSDVHGSPSRFLTEIPTELVEEIRPRINVSRPVAFVQSAYREDIGPMPTGMRLGQRVRHGKFGEGIVLNVEGQGAQARVQVNFERQGPKWLMIGYANLELM